MYVIATYGKSNGTSKPLCSCRKPLCLSWWQLHKQSVKANIGNFYLYLPKVLRCVELYTWFSCRARSNARTPVSNRLISATAQSLEIWQDVARMKPASKWVGRQARPTKAASGVVWSAAERWEAASRGIRAGGPEFAEAAGLTATKRQRNCDWARPCLRSIGACGNLVAYNKWPRLMSSMALRWGEEIPQRQTAPSRQCATTQTSTLATTQAWNACVSFES